MVVTWKNKFNKLYGFDKDKSHSVEEIAKITGFELKGLKKIVEKGQGAFFTNRKSVRPHVSDPTHWGMSRLYSAVMGGKSAKIDKDLLIFN
jgi:hypothetical protein